jgi:hypothetical protein
MKIIIGILFLTLPSFAVAQFTKGQVFLGGTLSATNNNNDLPTIPSGSSLKSSTFSVTPVVGFFINPKLALGGSIGYATGTSQFDYANYGLVNGAYTYTILSQKSVSKSLLVSTFARYYVPLGNSFYFTLQGQLNFTRTANDQTSPQYNGTNYDQVTQRTPSYSLGVSVRPAFVFFPTPRWSIEGGVGNLSFTRTRYLPDVYSANNFSLNAGTFTFGVAYYFKRQ